MKLILTTELQLVALALKSIKGMTKEAGKSICTKYERKGTTVAFYVFMFYLWRKCSYALLEMKRNYG